MSKQRLAVFLWWAAILVGQELTNESVITLVHPGVGEDAVSYAVANQPGKYLTSADALVALKTAGVSDKVIYAMLGKAASATAAAPSSPEDGERTQATRSQIPRTRQGASVRSGVVKSSAAVGGSIGSGVGRVVGGTVGVGVKLSGMALRIAVPTAISLATRAALGPLL